MTIREATLTDVERIVEMGLRFALSTRYARFMNATEDNFTQLVTGLVQQDTEVIFVAESDARILFGMLAVGVGNSRYDGVLRAMEFFWWVEPNFRGAKAAKAMLRAAEAWAKGKGAEALIMLAPEPKVARFYERDGYEYVESLYSKRLDV